MWARKPGGRLGSRAPRRNCSWYFARVWIIRSASSLDHAETGTCRFLIGQNFILIVLSIISHPRGPSARKFRKYLSREKKVTNFRGWIRNVGVVSREAYWAAWHAPKRCHFLKILRIGIIEFVLTVQTSTLMEMRLCDSKPNTSGSPLVTRDQS